MRVAIQHETVLRYPAASTYSIAYLRLTPPSTAGQQVLSWKVNAKGNLCVWHDAYGNDAHVLVLEGPHEEMKITVSGEVDVTTDSALAGGGHEPNCPDVFLRATTATKIDESVCALVAPFAAAVSTAPQQVLDGLRAAVLAEQKGSVTTLNRFLAGARCLGLPARAVSGYLCHDSGQTVTAQCWAEVWISGSGWITVDLMPRPDNSGLVRLAIGMDHWDILPVRQQRQDIELEVSLSGRGRGN